MERKTTRRPSQAGAGKEKIGRPGRGRRLQTTVRWDEDISDLVTAFANSRGLHMGDLVNFLMKREMGYPTGNYEAMLAKRRLF